MTHISCASAVGNLIYAMMCTMSNLSQAVSIVSGYMYDPDRSHLWILRYIKDIIDVGLVVKKDVRGKQQCIRMLILTT